MSLISPHLLKCEKHSKKEEALAKLREGVKFDDVARELSEDKARQGRGALYPSLSAPASSAQLCPLHTLDMLTDLLRTLYRRLLGLENTRKSPW